MSNKDCFCWGMLTGCILTLVAVFVIEKVFSPPDGSVAGSTSAQAHRKASSPSVATSDKSAAITMRVSAYCPCEICCGPFADGITASGVPAVGRICAAPPEYPFGTVLDIEGYGEYVVRDRGGVIKGNRRSILFPTHAEAKAFGVQYLKVRIK